MNGKLETNTRLNEALKSLHDLNDEVGIMEERIGYAERVRGIPMLHHYSGGELSILLDVVPNRDMENIWGSLGEAGGIPRIALLINSHNPFDIDALKNWDEQSVFVSVVQNVYGPNGVIPSTVRAYLIEDEFGEPGAEVINCGMLFAGIFKPTFNLFVGLANGKFSSIVNERRDKGFDGLSPRIVQSTTKIVNRVCREKGDVVDCCGIGKLVYQNFCSELRISLDSGGITFMKFENSCIDVSSVMLGPLNL